MLIQTGVINSSVGAMSHQSVVHYHELFCDHSSPSMPDFLDNRDISVDFMLHYVTVLQ